MYLNQQCPGLVYECAGESVGPSKEKVYIMSVLLGVECFEGAGTSKKLAKLDAAKQALLKIYNVDCREGELS